MAEESPVPGRVAQDSGQQASGTDSGQQTSGTDSGQQASLTAQPPPLPQHVVKRTRMGGLWFASGSFAVVLLLLLIFILENGKSVDVAYFGAHGHVPLGVALLLAAVLGILMVVIPGTARIVQLRLTARRHRRADAGQQQPADTPAPEPR